MKSLPTAFQPQPSRQEDPSLSSDSTLRAVRSQVEQQLDALACPEYDVLVLDAPSGELRQLRTRLSPPQVLSEVPWLLEENLHNGEILFRPSDPGQITFLRGISEASVRSGEERGLEPAVVVRGTAGRHEVWLRSSEPLAAEEKEILDRFLAHDFQAAAPSPSHEIEYGHLAGFASPIGKNNAGLEQAFYPTLESTSGATFARAPVLVAAARDEVAQEKLQARAVHEVASLERDAELFAEVEKAYRDTSMGASLPALGSRIELEEAVLRLSLARDALAEADHRFSSALLGDDAVLSQEERERLADLRLEAFRRVHEAERPLEDLLGAYP